MTITNYFGAICLAISLITLGFNLGVAAINWINHTNKKLYKYNLLSSLVLFLLFILQLLILVNLK